MSSIMPGVSASRFAALKIDDASSSDEDPFQNVKTGKKKKASGGSSNAALKNAKKRARKKRNAQNEQSSEQTASSSAITDLDDVARHGPQSIPQAAAQTDEVRFERDLEEAIKQSNLEAERHRLRLQMAGLDSPTSSGPPLGFESLDDDYADGLSLPGNSTTDSYAAPQPVAPPARSHNQHDPDSVPDGWIDTFGFAPAPASGNIVYTIPVEITTRQPSPQLVRTGRSADAEPRKTKPEKKAVPVRSSSDEKFRVAVEAALQLALEQQKTTAAVKKKVDVEAVGVRVAELVDMMERKDKAISDLARMVQKLEGNLSEVKRRNRQLCHILSKGEMSSKSELVEQVEQLTTVKDELTEEVGELHSQLEQERSKNKHSHKGGKGSKSTN